ncbi:MAG TPA: tripartite tricarboxylate transporter substrate binding protein [Kiloniellales bacterium]
MPTGSPFHWPTARPVARLAAAVLAMLVAWVPLAAGSQDLVKPEGFPDRPLTIIVPYAEGGESDLLSRAMAAALEKVMGAKVLVVNQPGEAGMAAVPQFMAAPTDGYTLLESIEEAPANYAAGKLPENPAVDWWPLGMAQVTFSQIYVRPGDVRFADWQSFAAYARTSPGDVKIANVANSGAMERANLFKLEQAVGFKINQIGFDNPAERYAALIGGAVDALFEQPGDVASFLESGQMKPILTLLGERPAGHEKVPTLNDIGAGFEPLLRYRGFWILPGVPEPRRRYLETALHVAWLSEEFQAFNRQRAMHLIPSFRSHEEATAMIEKSIDAYREIFREMGPAQ